MALVTPNQLASTAGTPTVNNATGGGDTVKNARGRTMLRIANGSGAGITATIAPNAAFPSRPADGIYPAQAPPSKVITVGAGAAQIIGPIEKVYNSPTTGEFPIAWSAATSVTFEAYELPD